MNFYDILAAEKWDGGIPTINFFDLLFAQSISDEQWQVYEGTLPATLNANGSDLRQYQIWGNTGGVGDKTVNLWDGTYGVLNKYLNESGNEVSSNDWRISKYIPISDENYTLINILGGTPCACFYDVNYDFISSVRYYATTKKDVLLQAPSNAEFIRISVPRIGIYTDSDKISLTPGSTAPASFVPFGYELDIGVKSMNIFDAEIVQGSFSSSTGEQFVTTTQICSAFEDETLAAGAYTINADGVDDVVVYVYDTNKHYILAASIIIWQALPFTFTLNANVYVRFAFRYSDNSNITPANISNIMLTKGATTPIYIGDEPLDKDEYVDYQAGKVYRMINGVLTPTNPPVPLPALPTLDGTTIIDYVGQSVAPEKVLLEYAKGGN